VPGTIIVVFLALFLALTLLRGLKSDFVRFSIEDSEFSGLLDEQGWKLISGDVFRPPLNLHLFCAILGNGAQLLSVTCILLLMAMLRERGLYYYAELQRMTLVLYILTSLISGTISSYFYKQLGGTYWKRTLLTTNLLFIGPLFLDWCVMYSFSLYYGITPSLHYSSVLLLVILWLLVGFPLTVAGSLIGRRTTKVFDFPCRPNTIPRELPKLPWSKSRAFYLLAGGVVPFLALLFGLFCIFQNIWGRQSGLSYGLLAVVFTLALVNTAFVSIYLVFSRLDSEDYHWWWPSIFNTGFSSVLLLIFSLWYYHFWSRMHGPFQAAHFYGHVFVLGYSIFLILGFVGFVSSLKFVKYIYGSIKMD
jgi:transmembrane 9 superfamily protein 1